MRESEAKRQGWNPEQMNRAAHPHLMRFWRGVAHADAAGRLAALIRCASVVLGRADAVRRHLRRRTRQHETAGDGACWACGHARRRIFHHIIQLQHGGTNARKNTVAICEECHAHIHPHLSMPTWADGRLGREARRRLVAPLDMTPRLIRR